MKFMVLRLTALFLIAGLFFISCSDSTSSNGEGEPPEIPPIESLQVDLDIFSSQPKAVQQTDTTFFRAYFTASILGGFLQLTASPVYYLAQAAENTPEYNGDGEWKWSYSASGPNGSASVSLLATVEGNDVEWNFYVSASGGGQDFDNVLLFSGTSTIDGEEGTWNIYNPETENVVTSSEWSVTEASTSVTMNVYEDGTNIPVATISYNYSGTTKSISFENNSEGTDVLIEWDTDTKAGFIIDSDFNGGEQTCWDSNFQDTACVSA